MAGHLVILCNIERIPTLDEGAGADKMLGFGLNLTTAWSEEATAEPLPHPNILKTWSWSRIEKVKYQWLKADFTAVEAAGEADLKRQPLPMPKTLTTLIDRLEQEYVKSAGKKTDLVWIPPDSKPAQINQTLSDTERPWHTVLGQTSTYPYPFPQAFNIAHLFRVKAPEDAMFLAVAPVLKKNSGSGFPREDLTPGAGPEKTADPRLRKWEIKAASGDVKAVAYLAPCVRELAVKADAFIDLKEQWVRRTPTMSATDKTTQFGEDWQAQLEVRLSQAFQLPLIILNYLRGLRDKKEPEKEAKEAEIEADIKACVYLFLATLRDVAGIGAHPALEASSDSARIPKVNDSRFAARLFRSYDKTISLSKTEWEEIEDKEKASFGTLAQWKKFLQGEYATALKDQGPGGESLSSQVSKLAILSEGYKPQSRLATLAELERLAGFFFDSSEQDTLWSLFLAQWQFILSKAILGEPKKRAIEAAIKEAARKGAGNIRLDLRQQLTLNNLDVFWHKFTRSNSSTADPHGHELIESCFPAYLRYYLIKRIQPDIEHSETGCEVPKVLPRPLYPLVDAAEIKENVRADLRKVADEWSGQYRAELLPRAEAFPPTDTPHAVTIQMGRLEPIPEESSAFTDPLRQISGIGVLMREEGGTAWRLLNMADVWTSHPTEEVNVEIKENGESNIIKRPKPEKLELGEPVLVPFRVSYKGGLRQVCVSYNNQPLIADSPLSNPKIAGYELNQLDKTEQRVLTHYRYSRHELAKMSYLKFGRKYKLASFAIRSSGVLPKAIAEDYTDTDVKTPCRVDSSKLMSVSPPADAVHEVAYQRRVKIGALRLLSLKNRNGRSMVIPFEPPAIPASVSPRARDLDALKSEEMPLLLLAPKNWKMLDSVEFHVKRPAVSLECWDRWVAGEEDAKRVRDKETRKKIFAEFYRQAKENKAKDEKKGEQTDLLLDDPAPARLLHVQLFDESGTRLLAEKTVVVPRPTGTGLQTEQCPPIRIKCECIDGEPGLADLANGAHVKVKKGEAYSLVISACVPVEYVDRPGANRIAWFAPGIVPTEKTIEFAEEAGGEKKTFYLVSPKQIAIEAATDELPEPQMLWKGFETAFLQTPDKKQWAVGVHLGPGLKGTRQRARPPLTEAERKPFRNIGRVELQRQVWRWQGRATKLHPDLEVTPPAERNKCVRIWEAVEFGDRPDSDQTASQMAMRPDEFSKDVPAQGFRCFDYREVLQGGEGRDEVRSLHFRFAVKAFSRYESIMPAFIDDRDKSAVTALDPVEPKGQWKYQFVPCRKKPPTTDEPIAVPKIKLILPLTESYGEGHKGSPGLLVVLNEPWHEIAGIGERLEAEVILTPDPSEELGKATQGYFEVGPDPTLRIDGRIKDPAPIGSTKVNFDSAKIIGPVGHYFDRDNTFALFVGTSFILPAPNLPIDEKSLSWYFAKVKFRRSFISHDPGLESEYAPEKKQWTRQEVRSNFTDPFWVQYLPEFSIYGEINSEGAGEQKRNTVSNLRLKFEANANISLRKENGSLMKLGSSGENFRLYLVLTGIVSDVTGRRDQEQYLGLFSPVDNDEWRFNNDDSVGSFQFDPQRQYRARVIEVQRPSGSASTSLTLWGELFGTEATNNEEKPPWEKTDSQARIVRISEPIEQEGYSTDCEAIMEQERKGLSTICR